MTTAHTQTTTTLAVTTRRRAFSLSLLGKQDSSHLHNLPAEIIISILELALFNDQPAVLALISRIIKQFVNIIIYRTVVLDTPQSVTLFYRTASSPRSSHLLSHVKRLAVTWEPEYFTLSIQQQLRQIVVACTSLRAIAVPSCCQISTSPSGFPSDFLHHDGPAELTIQNFEELGDGNPSSSGLPLLPAYFSTSLTHLRICEPSDTWQSPLSIIAALNYAPNLTHLQLARRADSNEDNDIVFAENISYLLSTRKNLKVVVVSIFCGLMRTSATPVQESSIWMLVSNIQEMDSRVVVVEGEFGEWRNEWKDVKDLQRGGRPVDFWDTVQQQEKMEIESEEENMEIESGA